MSKKLHNLRSNVISCIALHSFTLHHLSLVHLTHARPPVIAFIIVVNPI